MTEVRIQIECIGSDESVLNYYILSHCDSSSGLKICILDGDSEKNYEESKRKIKKRLSGQSLQDKIEDAISNLLYLPGDCSPEKWLLCNIDPKSQDLQKNLGSELIEKMSLNINVANSAECKDRIKNIASSSSKDSLGKESRKE